MSRARGNSYDTLNAKLDEALVLIKQVVPTVDPGKQMQLAFFERDLIKVKKNVAEKSQNLEELWREAIETINKIKARYQTLQQISEEDVTPFDDLTNFFNEKKAVLDENPQAFEVQDASIDLDSIKLEDGGPASEAKPNYYIEYEIESDGEEEKLVGGRKDKDGQHVIIHTDQDQDLDERKEESPRLQHPRHSMVMFHTRANNGSMEFTPEQKVIQEKIAEVLAIPLEDNLTEEEVKLYEKNKNADESDPKVLIIMLNSHVTTYLNLINKFGKADNAQREAIMQELKRELTQIQAKLNKNKNPPLDPEQSVEWINFLLSQIQAAKEIAPAFNKAIAEIELTGKNPYEKTTARIVLEPIFSFFGKSKEPSLTETFNQYKEDRLIIHGLVRALEAKVKNLAAPGLQHEAQNSASSAPNPTGKKFG